MHMCVFAVLYSCKKKELKKGEKENEIALRMNKYAIKEDFEKLPFLLGTHLLEFIIKFITVKAHVQRLIVRWEQEYDEEKKNEFQFNLSCWFFLCIVVKEIVLCKNNKTQ